MYGATVGLLMNVFEPSGVSVGFADVCDLDGFRAAGAEARPGCIGLESISNPLLRVGDIAAIAGSANEAGAALAVDKTFATPLHSRPLELGSHCRLNTATQ